MTTEILLPDAMGLSRAVSLLRKGSLVAFPTETVYGLGADARREDAVAGIFAAKERPGFNPLIVHVADIDEAAALAIVDTRAAALAARFWPGPLTLVLPRRSDAPLAERVTAGLPSVGLRVPAGPTAQQLLRAFGGPVAAPSANPSGRISPTEAAHVVAGLGDRVAAVIDGGPCGIGLESTIVDLTDATACLLRPGGVPREALEDALGAPLADPPSDPGRITAPGQLSSHYAPRAPLRLSADSPRADELYLGFGPGRADLNLSPSGNLEEAAATLFAALHRLDALGRPIAVAPIPDTGLGRAINDRLRRAAAPRAVPARGRTSGGQAPR